MSSPSSSTAAPVKDSSGQDNESLAADTPSLYRDPSFASLGTSSGQDEFFACLEHAEHALKQMENYFQNQQLCDVVLIAGVDGKRWVVEPII